MHSPLIQLVASERAAELRRQARTERAAAARTQRGVRALVARRATRPSNRRSSPQPNVSSSSASAADPAV